MTYLLGHLGGVHDEVGLDECLGGLVEESDILVLEAREVVVLNLSKGRDKVSINALEGRECGVLLPRPRNHIWSRPHRVPKLKID